MRTLAWQITTAEYVIVSPELLTQSDASSQSQMYQKPLAEMKDIPAGSFDISKLNKQNLPTEWQVGKLPKVSIEQYEIIATENLSTDLKIGGVYGYGFNRTIIQNAGGLGHILRFRFKITNTTVYNMSATESDWPLYISVWNKEGTRFVNTLTDEVSSNAHPSTKYTVGPGQEMTYISDFFIPKEEDIVYAYIYPKPMVINTKSSDQKEAQALNQQYNQYLDSKPIVVEINISK